MTRAVPAAALEVLHHHRPAERIARAVHHSEDAGVSLLRGQFDPRAILWVNRASGLIIVGCGVAALAGVAR